MPALASHLELAIYRVKYWLTHAIERRDRFVPPPRMRPEQIAHMQAKLNADIERARAAVSGLELEAWKHKANFGGLEL